MTLAIDLAWLSEPSHVDSNACISIADSFGFIDVFIGFISAYLHIFITLELSLENFPESILLTCD